ncbi:hypothetical protein BC829DRAFT_213858 [Chytridium lagenaria]|nr:hypothetical protein BC829DRAFT_213858 [Chytridium lagenaria]
MTGTRMFGHTEMEMEYGEEDGFGGNWEGVQESPVPGFKELTMSQVRPTPSRPTPAEVCVADFGDTEDG